MRLAILLLGLAVAAGMPLLAGEFWITLLTQIMIFGLLALSADLLLGHAGLFSLCHASFFAVAAYTTAILQVRYGATDRARRARRHPGRLGTGIGVRRRGAHARRLFHPRSRSRSATSSGASPTAGPRSPAATMASPTCRSRRSARLRVAGATQYYYVVLVAVVAVRARPIACW